MYYHTLMKKTTSITEANSKLRCYITVDVINMYIFHSIMKIQNWFWYHLKAE